MSLPKKIIHAIKSLTTAMLGIQSKSTAHIDCSSNNPLLYIAIAIVLLICFVITIIIAAKLVLL